MHYRDNWYLDAWCHWRGGLRSFSVDAIRAAEILDTPARNVPEKTLDQVLGSGYGIFAGRKVSWAKLKFTPERARWVAPEQWQPRQRSRFDADGNYVLHIPYSDERELLMDILKHGAEVEVLGPRALRENVARELKRTYERYDQS